VLVCICDLSDRYFCHAFLNIGDPGSPIFQWFIDHWQQVGITSHIIDFDQFRNLGIYTRLVEYNDWIQSIISDCSTISPTPPTTVSTASTTTTTGKPPITYQCDKTSTCGCGPTPVVLTPLRIVGGENAAEFSWPMIASLRWMNEDAHICGGSIISNSYILTAAHCIRFIPDSPIDVTIAVGMTNLSDPKQIRRTVDRAYIHPSYIGRNDNYRHDIALLHINQSLTFEVHPSIAKTCIHRLSPSILNNQYIKNGTRLTVIGWGDTKVVSDPQILQQVEVYAIDNEDQICKNSMNDSQTQFCAGLPEGGKG
jgi:secreted trypsin-like serine protease